MKREFYILFYFLFFSFNGYCQQWEWAKRIGGSTNYDFCDGITLDKNGFIYVAGSFSGISYFDTTQVIGSDPYNNLFFAKMDPLGNFLWIKHVYCSSTHTAENIHVSDDGTITISGSFTDTIIFNSDTLFSPTHTDNDIFIAQFDSMGNQKWVKQISSKGHDTLSRFFVDSKKNTFVTAIFGDTLFFANDTLSYYGGLDCFQIDSNGTFINYFPLVIKKARSNHGIIYDEANGSFYFCAGFTDTLFLINNSIPSSGLNEFIIKTNSVGTSSWLKTFSATSGIGSKSLARDNDWNIYHSGYFIGNLIFGADTLKSFSALNSFIVSFDSSGNYRWSKKIQSNFDNQSWNIDVDSNNNILFVGDFTNTTYFDSITIVPQGSSEAYIVQYDSFGSFLKVIHMGSLGDYADAYRIKTLPNGFYVAGEFNQECNFDTIMLSSTSFSEDAYIAKYVYSTTGIELPQQSISFSSIAFPNPGNGIFSVFINSDKNDIFILSVFNSIGQTVLSQSLSLTKELRRIPINISSVSDGIYFLKITDSQNHFSMNKLIVQH